jgi:hypothetical protein
METSPFLGLGFGYDLAARFLRTYERDLGEEFEARSPHSYLITIMGRTGIIGVVFFLGILTCIVKYTVREFQWIRKGIFTPMTLQWWCFIWITLATAMFGVVLEGPMAAVPFWTLLGVATADHLTKRKFAAENNKVANARMPADLSMHKSSRLKSNFSR